jgi:hypothetical protein
MTEPKFVKWYGKKNSLKFQLNIKMQNSRHVPLLPTRIKLWVPQNGTRTSSSNWNHKDIKSHKLNKNVISAFGINFGSWISHKFTWTHMICHNLNSGGGITLLPIVHYSLTFCCTYINMVKMWESPIETLKFWQVMTFECLCNFFKTHLNFEILIIYHIPFEKIFPI